MCENRCASWTHARWLYLKISVQNGILLNYKQKSHFEISDKILDIEDLIPRKNKHQMFSLILDAMINGYVCLFNLKYLKNSVNKKSTLNGKGTNDLKDNRTQNTFKRKG